MLAKVAEIIAMVPEMLAKISKMIAIYLSETRYFRTAGEKVDNAIQRTELLGARGRSR